MPHGVSFAYWWDILHHMRGRFVPKYRNRAEQILAQRYRPFKPSRRFQVAKWRPYRG